MNGAGHDEARQAGRLIAVGDIHGCLAALVALLEAIQPRPEDRIVTLGDYVDRGPDSRGVLEELIGLAKRCRLIPLLGNHDEMLLDVCGGRRWLLNDWLAFGGAATLASYAGAAPERIPREHIEFLERARSLYEAENAFFVHASYLPEQPLNEQPVQVMHWQWIRRNPPGPHVSGKTAFVGHTSQKDGRILDLGYLKCIDTCCYGGKWLTAMEVRTGQVWQADPAGKPRGMTNDE